MNNNDNRQGRRMRAVDSTYIAFPSSPKLRELSREFIRKQLSSNAPPQHELVRTIMLSFTDELLQVFLLDIVDAVKLSPFMERLVHGTANTIRSTAHRVTGSIVHKLDQRQLSQLAEYIRDIMLTAPGRDGEATPWVGFPIEAAFEARLRRVITQLRGDNPKGQVSESVAVLCEIADRAIEVYMVRPTELIRLGFLLRKITDAGTHVIRGAIHVLIRRLLPDLGPKQFADLGIYLEAMLLKDPLLEER